MDNQHMYCGDRRPWRLFRVVGLVVGGLVFASVFALAFGWLVMLLWNWLMPNLFGLKPITYWQAFGILILAKLLFGGLGHGHKRHHRAFAHARRHHGMGLWGGREDWDPSHDFGQMGRNWFHYREYWKVRGKKDFEDYLRETGKFEDAKPRDAGN